MSKDATASPSRVKDNNTVLYPPNVAVKTEFCCFVVPEKSIDFVFLSITWIDAHHDAVFCLTHLFSRQGQHLHERLLLIQPSHIHTQKYHKEWFLLSSKQSGQQGSSSNWRTTSHLLYCTFTQKKKEMGDSVSVFFFIFILFSVQFSAEIWLCELLSEKFAIPESASVLPVEMGDEEEWERAKEGWTEWKKLRCEEKARKKWKREWEGGRGGEVLSEGG